MAFDAAVDAAMAIDAAAEEPVVDAGVSPPDAALAIDADVGPSCDDCDVNATCDTSDTGITCICDPGYLGDGFVCNDVDECAVTPSPCGDGECVNQDGTYACDCPLGYIDNGTTCIDIDECAADDPSHDCSPDATCTNTPGSFTCTCNDGFFGDGITCRIPASCADLLVLNPAASTGIHTIDSDVDGPGEPFDVFCNMDVEGGGWTLLMVSSDDGVDTWTMFDRARMTDDTAPIGSLDAINRDFKSPAYHQMPFQSLLFVHAPSGITAAYDGVSDGSGDFASFLAAIDYPVCDFSLAGNGFPQTGGTLTQEGLLCDTDLYFNLGDHEDDSIEICSNPASRTSQATFGPVWSIGNNAGCPFDDPAFAAFGPREQCGGCPEETDRLEHDARGFGGPLNLNTGAVGAGENFIQMLAR